MSPKESSTDYPMGSLECRRVQRLLEATESLALIQDGLVLLEPFAKEHLSHCVACQQVVQDESELKQAMSTLPVLSVREGFSTQVMSRIKQRSPKRKPAVILRSIAAGFALLVAAGFLTSTLMQSPSLKGSSSTPLLAYNNTEDSSSYQLWMDRGAAETEDSDTITDNLQDMVGF